MDDINNASPLKKMILILSYIPSAIAMFVFSLFPPIKIINKVSKVYSLNADGHKTEAASIGISLLEQLLKDKSEWQLKSQNHEVYYHLFEISIRNSIDTFNKKKLETIDNLCEIWYLQKDISKKGCKAHFFFTIWHLIYLHKLAFIVLLKTMMIRIIMKLKTCAISGT